MRCQWCGKEFQKVTSWQRYCSDLCRVQANRHNKRKEEKAPPDAMILRSFVCMHCDEMVNVTDPKDNRYRFCSPRCERLYWKHPEKGKKTFSRIFYCQYCGKKVVTNDPKDRRRFYCSKECRLASHQMQRTMTRHKEKLYREKTVVKERGDI